MTNPRSSSQIAKGDEKARCGRISEPSVFSSPAFRIRKKSGIVSASPGTIWATRNITSRVVRKRNLKRATAVAARKAITADSTTTLPATARLLRKYRPKSCWPKTRWKEPSDGASVQGRGLVDSISPAGLGADSTIQ